MATTKITTDVISDSAINTSKIADSAVNTIKIADEAVISSKLANDSISYAKLGTEFTTSAVLATDVDFSTAQVFTKTLSGDTTLTFSNDSIGMIKDLVLTGDFTLTFPTGSKIAAGTYDGIVSNLIQVLVVGAADYWITISQEAV